MVKIQEKKRNKNTIRAKNGGIKLKIGREEVEKKEENRAPLSVVLFAFYLKGDYRKAHQF